MNKQGFLGKRSSSSRNDLLMELGSLGATPYRAERAASQLLHRRGGRQPIHGEQPNRSDG